MSTNAQDESPMTAEQAVEIGDTPPIIVSRYGNRVVEWPLQRLTEFLRPAVTSFPTYRLTPYRPTSGPGAAFKGISLGRCHCTGARSRPIYFYAWCSQNSTRQLTK
jgi:hypothetical protein